MLILIVTKNLISDTATPLSYQKAGIMLRGASLFQNPLLLKSVRRAALANKIYVCSRFDIASGRPSLDQAALAFAAVLQKANKSALICSGFVVHMPCGSPG